MFVQVIEGRIGDLNGLNRQTDRWLAELRPGATGFLGSTGGATSDGRYISFARFESEAAARANSERPEQGEWWTETEKYFDGDAEFHDSEDVSVLMGGGSDDAGFVQVMKYTDVDRAQVEALDAVFEEHGAKWRDDVIGGLRVWTGPRSCIECMYFTSESDARAGEQKEPPPELAEHMGTFESLMAGVEFLDISEPRIA